MCLKIKKNGVPLLISLNTLVKIQEREIKYISMGRKKKVKKIKKTTKKQKTVTTKKLVGQKTFKSNDEKIEIKKIKKKTPPLPIMR